MASLFQKRLRCFYCGQRSGEKKSATVRNWRCDQCEAVNYLDENGEITDPPTSVTDAPDVSMNAAQSSSQLSAFDQTELFCSKCIRNQQILINILGSYLPDIDDPRYPAFEKEYPRYRRNMEERYPQACENCEQKVNERLRETGYEAKADHLRRIMDRSKRSRASRRARNRNWRHIVDIAGLLGYWISIVVQLVSNVMGALEGSDAVIHRTPSPLLVAFMSHRSRILSWIGCSSQDLASFGLIPGLLTIWWNPRLHYKVEGFNGRILGLNQYYQCQLIVMATRFGLWALLKDTDNFEPNLPPTLHAFMIFFMILTTIASRRIIKYDIRPLVEWSNTESSASQEPQVRNGQTKSFTTQQPVYRFPIEKLGTPRETPRQNTTQLIAPDPGIEDSMDWTPSRPQEIHPRFVNVVQQNVQPPREEKSPFYGSLPQAPRPPAWQLRNPITQKPVEKGPEPNPFHQSETDPENIARNDPFRTTSPTSDVHFAPPKFFPPSDYTALTGLENIFHQAFTIKSPEEDVNENAVLKSTPRVILSKHSRWRYIYASIRFGSLSICPVMWMIDKLELTEIPRDFMLIAALIINILFTGFGFLASLNKPTLHARSVLYSLIKFIGAIFLCVYLSYHFSKDSLLNHDGNLEICVKGLSALLAVEESLGLLAIYHRSHLLKHSVEPQTGTPTQPATQLATQPSAQPLVLHAHEEPMLLNRLVPTPTVPSSQRSFYPIHPYSRYETQNQNYGVSRKDTRYDPIRDDGSDVSEVSAVDSDAETTTTTSYINTTIRNMNPFSDRSDDFTPLRTQGLGSGLQGLSLDDGPQRMTRSRAARAMGTTTTGADTSRRYQARRVR
ncbi:Ima1 N-terminal domain-containing protein [Talaromyces proteolyticus]|uniref:Ima1 N-terminal domain-containing protein n=1 Tax=Talaromyces proteolyticus TaxID=1131652 RepID=A0AAD4KVP7_9EURO|nr:Ima1 N-terminal domain-containing protein [Talaromyces proteolyticus]KAH8697164.1 Ima1 N-terminal domain-containing protein [Talaromyces proteolyticus]